MRCPFFYMSRISIISLVAVTLLAAGTGYWLRANEVPASSAKRPKVWPKPTEPPPASPDYQDVNEPVPTEADIDRAIQEYTTKAEQTIERALLAGDAQRREAVFSYLLPELLQMEPDRVLGLLARLEPGPPRDMLRKEIAQLWIHQDAAAAARWLKSLDETERRETAITAVTSLAPFEPAQASAIARELEVGSEERVRRLLTAARL
jgi:hypothetical protein